MASEVAPNDSAFAPGANRRVVVPSPSCPESLEPQHTTAPVSFKAHECVAPTATSTTPDSPLTAVGVDVELVVPFPS